MENICICNQIPKYDKRDDFKSHCITYLEEWHKPDRNKLWVTCYATEQFVLDSLDAAAAALTFF
ncbi:MAG: hypothetical protein ABJB73_04740 [Candidatus Nitrosocosmicus sp.]